MKMKITAIAIVAAGLLAFQPAYAASPGCNLEVSGGLGVGTLEVMTIDLAAQGAIVGVGADCYVQQGAFQVGLLGRYNFMNVGGSQDQIEYDKMWELALKAGVKFNEHTTLYGLAGWSGTDLSLGTLDKSPNGLMLGAGLDLALTKHTALRFEYAWHDFNKENIIGPVSASADLHVFRLGFVLALGGESPFSGMTIPDDPPPASGDPKLSNPRRR